MKGQPAERGRTPLPQTRRSGTARGLSHHPQGSEGDAILTPIIRKQPRRATPTFRKGVRT